MSNGSHIRAVPGDEKPTEGETPEIGSEDTAELEAEPDPDHEYEWVEEEPAHRSLAWLIPVLAVLAVTVWTGFYVTANIDAMVAGAGLQQWLAWTTDWAMPVILVLLAWLIAMRSSSREASRFGDAARELSLESARLEEKLVNVNRELSLAREFLGSQTRDLEFLGRSASERISEHAERLQTLVQDNGEQVDRIANVSTTALENMDKLRGDLPVVANSARDVSNQIGNAGRTAKGQLSELVAGFERLNEFGTASERQVSSLQERVDAAITAFREQADELGSISAARFDALREESDAFRTQLDGREVEALAAIRSRAVAFHEELDTLASDHATQREEAISALDARIAALCETAALTSEDIREGQAAATEVWALQIDAMRDRMRAALDEISTLDSNALRASNEKLQALAAEAERVDERLARRDGLFAAKLAERENALADAENHALQTLSARMAEIDSQIAVSRDEQAEHIQAFAEKGEEIASRLAAMGEQTARIAKSADEAETRISASSALLAGTVNSSQSALSEVESALSALTNSSVRMLELLQASARQSKDDLPAAIGEFETRLETAETRTQALRSALGDAQAMGERLGNAVIEAEDRGMSAAANLEDIAARIVGTTSEQSEALDTLRSRLTALDDSSVASSERIQGELRTAIAALEDKARAALESIETEQAGRVHALAASIGEESGAAIDRAVKDRVESAIGELDIASTKASENSRQAAIQLRDQLTKVNELTKNLEARVTRAREQAEEQTDNDFSRRVALITDSLNSNAIDIGKALSTDVTDTAWTAYLKGDRGIFTRRAVKLLENTELREIANLYESEPDFHEHVSRYIHDFETMLRSLLSTRNGNALSVTVLSSDMGKLYVALAQAIERLRD